MTDYTLARAASTTGTLQGTLMINGQTQADHAAGAVR
jgi:hypothetical protein